MAKRTVHYRYSMKRPGYGYNPGDFVDEEWARGHPWAVTPRPDAEPETADEQQERDD